MPPLSQQVAAVHDENVMFKKVTVTMAAVAAVFAAVRAGDVGALDRALALPESDGALTALVPLESGYSQPVWWPAALQGHVEMLTRLADAGAPLGARDRCVAPEFGAMLVDARQRR